MKGARYLVLASLALSCSTPVPLHAQQATPVIPFAPTAANDWPIWQTPTGFLVGGSGYVVGGVGPLGVTPGLGIGAVLLPSRLPGSWLSFPGEIPWPPPAFLPGTFPVWANASEVEAHASDVGNVLVPAPILPTPVPTPSPPPLGASASEQAAYASDLEAYASDRAATAARPRLFGPSPVPAMLQWSKMGVTALLPPAYTEWPKPPFMLPPWGPVTVHPKAWLIDNVPMLLGFPTADGTPVSQGNFQPFIRRYKGITDIVLFDYVTRALLLPPSLIPTVTANGVSARDGLLLIGRPSVSGALQLLDLLTGGYDPLPELQDANPQVNGNLTLKGAFIPYTAGPAGQRRVHLFDRRTRLVDRLSHLNVGDENFAPAADQLAHVLAYVTLHRGQTDLAIYNTATGLVDPLPAVNTSANESIPTLDDSGRWLSFLTDRTGTSQALLYDRYTRSIDTLPELNRLGPVVDVGITSDALVVYAVVVQDGHDRAVLYLRPSGFIDPLPEVNLPDAVITF